jgi:hypothetical protein
MSGRVTPKGTKPKVRRRVGPVIKGHYPVPVRGGPPGIDAPGMVWRRCSCGSMFGGSNAQKSLESHCRFGPQPTLDAPCCQRWDLDDATGWRTARTCTADCDHDHEHFGEPVPEPVEVVPHVQADDGDAR